MQIGAVVSGATLEEGIIRLRGTEEATVLPLSWLSLVEVEVEGFDDLLEELRALRGAVISTTVTNGDPALERPVGVRVAALRVRAPE